MSISYGGLGRLITARVCGIGMVAALAYDAPGANADDWEHRATVYGWLAGIDGQTRFPIEDPEPVEIDASDILDDLKMVFMGSYEGRKDQWSVLADVVYLDLGDSKRVDTPLGSVIAGFDLKSWVVHGAIGYALPAPDRSPAHLVAGVRYLALDGELEGSRGEGPGRSTSESESVTDAFLGVRGHLSLGDRWFLPYHADIGAGGSDYSYQLFAGLGYRTGNLDIEIGYRHLFFDLGDKRFMTEFQISGPALGLGLRF